MLYCASGFRSIISVSLLAHAGFTDGSELLGSYDRTALAEERGMTGRGLKPI